MFLLSSFVVGKEFLIKLSEFSNDLFHKYLVNAKFFLPWTFSFAVTGTWNPLYCSVIWLASSAFNLNVSSLERRHLLFCTPHPSIHPFGKRVTQFYYRVPLLPQFKACGLGGMDPMFSSRHGPNWLEPISLFHYPGHSGSFRDGLVSQDVTGHLLGLLGKESSFLFIKSF